MKKKSMPYGVYHLLTCVLAVVMAVLVVLGSPRAGGQILFVTFRHPY